MMNIRVPFRIFLKAPNEEIMAYFIYPFLIWGILLSMLLKLVFMGIYASGIQLTVLDTDALSITLEMSPIYSNAGRAQIT